jgi:allantoinase
MSLATRSASGQSVRLHGKVTHTSPAIVRSSGEAVEKATGKRPIGWSGPDFQETPNTPNLLAAEGIRYVCDWGNDEQPYKMTPKTGELYSLGVHAYLDDNYVHLHGRRTINEVNLLWREWSDGLYADGAITGRLMVLHLHPWIMGQRGLTMARSDRSRLKMR